MESGFQDTKSKNDQPHMSYFYTYANLPTWKPDPLCGHMCMDSDNNLEVRIMGRLIQKTIFL